MESPSPCQHPKHVVEEVEGSIRESRFCHGGDGWGSLARKEVYALHLRSLVRSRRLPEWSSVDRDTRTIG